MIVPRSGTIYLLLLVIFLILWNVFYFFASNEHLWPSRRPGSFEQNVTGSNVSEYYSSFPAEIPMLTGSENDAGKSYDFVYLINNAVFHDSSKKKGKQVIFDIGMRSMLGALRKSGAVDTTQKAISFALDLKASGNCALRNIPCFCIGKKQSSAVGLLVPNPFFVDPVQWDKYARRIHEIALSRPVASRKGRAVWRGMCGPGAAARLQLLEVALLNTLIDASFTGVDGFPSILECIDVVGSKIGMSEESRSAIKALNSDVDAPSRKLSQVEYSQYRYVIHMPGAATGSYSRNLQFMWLHESVVVFWRSTGFEWYYSELMEGVNVVYVDQSDIISTLDRLEKNPSVRDAIRQTTWPFFEANLSGEAIITRWAEVLKPLYERQGTKNQVPEGWCSCDKEDAAFQCDFCDEVKQMPKLPQYTDLLEIGRTP